MSVSFGTEIPSMRGAVVEKNVKHQVRMDGQTDGWLLYISLSMVVLNSRDWSEIVWVPENLCFKNQPCNRFYPKKPTGMHWLGCNDNFEINLYFVCQPACLPACRKTRLC